MKGYLICLVIAVLTTSVQGLGEDLTLLIGQKGSIVVEAVVDKIRENCIFPGDRLFLTRLALVQSNNGLNDETYRDDYYGGIWQIDEDKYNSTQTCPGTLKEACRKIQTTLNIDWTETTWVDLRKPLFSGLAASLYIMFKENITSGYTENLPGDRQSQSKIWQKLFAPANHTSDFVNTRSSSNKDTCDNRLIDLAFIIDSSGSIGEDNFNKTRRFITDVVKGLNIDKTQIAVVKFNESARVEFYLDNYTDIANLTRAVTNIYYTRGGTNTAEALNITADSVFVERNGMRPGAAKVAVVVTDGLSNNSNDTIAAAPILKSKGVIVFSVGVGGANPVELETISSDVDCTHVFILNDFSEIETITADIQKKACRVYQDLGYNLTGTVHVQIPPYNVTGTLVTNVTCGVVKIYVSYNSTPSDALYTHRDFALPGEPSVIRLENGKQAFVTYEGVKYKEPILRTIGCKEPVFTSSVQANPLGAEIICRTNGIEHNCTLIDFQLSGLNEYVKDEDFVGTTPCNENVPENVFISIPRDPTKFIKCDTNGNKFVTQCPGGQEWNEDEYKCNKLIKGPPLESKTSLPTVNKTENKNPTNETRVIVDVFNDFNELLNNFFNKTIRSEVVCRRYGQEVNCTLFDIQISEYSKYLVKDSWNDVLNLLIQCDTNADFRDRGNILKKHPFDARKFIVCTKAGDMYVTQCPTDFYYFADVLLKIFECRRSQREVSPSKPILDKFSNKLVGIYDP